MSNPFLIEGPAVISFSGGRTSGYMLWGILQSHGGKLPDDVRVIFANTGKEMPETLDFVRECAERWGVPITWVEYLRGEVTYETASRNGEPYDGIITKRSYLPNPVQRFCTQALKLDEIAAEMKRRGYEHWLNCVGIRADEPGRFAKLNARPAKYESVAPLYRAGISKAEVLSFWAGNAFDLALPHSGVYSNCTLCFLKGANQITSMIREHPERALWWMEKEKEIGATFRSDRPSYKRMYEAALNQGEMFDFDEPLQDCFCTD